MKTNTEFYTPTPPDTSYTRKFNNREKIDSYTPSTSQPPNPIPHSILGFLHLISPWVDNIHIHRCYHYLSLSISTTLSSVSPEEWGFTSLQVFKTNIFSPYSNVSHHQYPPPYCHPWWRTPPNCFLHDQSDLEMYGLPPPTSWCFFTALRSVVFFSFGNRLFPNLTIYFNRSLLETVTSWLYPDP